MPSLLGLSPEEINSIANNRVADQNSMANLLQAVGGYQEATDIIDVNLVGKSYKIRRKDLPEALKAGAAMEKLPGEMDAIKALTSQRSAAAELSSAQLPQYNQ